MSDKKLIIPDPNASPEDGHDGAFVAMLVAAALSVVAIYGFATFKKQPTTTASPPDTPVVKKDETIQALLTDRTLASELGALSRKELEARPWTVEEKKAVYQFGSATAAEVLCESDLAQIESGEYDGELLLELEKTLDRRADFAPWACLARATFDGKLTGGDIHKEVSEAIAEWSKFEGDTIAPAITVDRFRETRNRPESDRFYDWLRRCALTFEYAASGNCQRLLRQIAPAHGRDLLEVVDHLVQRGQVDRTTVLAAGKLAQSGQPEAWKVLESKELSDYDIDLRIGAILSLCRMLDDGPMGNLVAKQIAETAGVSTRTNHQTTRDRWWYTCSMLFGGDEEGEKPSQFLAKRATDDSPIRTDILFLAEHKICKNPENEPVWYCASQAWTANDEDIAGGLQETFVKTAWFEFVDDEGRSVFGD